MHGILSDCPIHREVRLTLRCAQAHISVQRPPHITPFKNYLELGF
jgi:hypothetical protein